MKVVLDTNIYVGWVRERAHAGLMLDYETRKYMSCVVLMELWAGARTRLATRTVERLLAPYRDAGRIVSLSADDYASAGQLMSDLDAGLRPRLREASFVNDILIALSARAIGATLYTRNRGDFAAIAEMVRGLRVAFV